MNQDVEPNGTWIASTSSPSDRFGSGGSARGARAAAGLADVDSVRAGALQEQAWRLRNEDPQEAQRLASEALEFAERADDTVGAAYALAARAYARMRLADNQGALDDARTSLESFNQNGEALGAQRCWNTLGIIHGDSSDYPASIEAFLESKRLCEELGDSTGEADALNNVGIVYVHLGDHSSALEYHLRSLSLSREIAYAAGEARSLTNLGVAYAELGRDHDALEQLQTSLELLDRDRERYTYAMTLHNMGRCHARLGEHAVAREELATAHRLLDALGYALAAGNALYSLGELELELGQVDRARSHFEHALEAQRDADDSRSQAETLLRLAQIERSSDQLDAALAPLRDALRLAEAAGARIETYRAHADLSEVLAARGNALEALEHHRSYTRIKDEVFNETSDLKMRATRIGFEVEQAQKEKEIFRLRNVELAEANDELRALTRSLREADQQKGKLLARLERQARTDALTGLANRRYFDLALQEAFDIASAGQRSLSVALCDVDNFKRVNDTFGHDVGDEVLRQMAELLRQTTRVDDVVARYGGEEFIVMLPDAPANEASAICERLRAAVENHPWAEIVQGLAVTLSIGVAGDLPVDHHEKLISAADDMLYQVKRTGKNRVEVAIGTGLAPALPEQEQLAAPPERTLAPPPRWSGTEGFGVTIERGVAPLETVRSGVGSVALLKSLEGLELTRGTLQQGGRLTLLPGALSQEVELREVYYVIEGELSGEIGGKRIEVAAGDQLYVEGLEETLILTAQSSVRFLYISTQPSFYRVSQELEQLQRLAVAVEVTDGYTANHCRRLQTLSLATGRELGLTPHRLHILDYAAYLHDVGKIRVPSQILHKPSALDDEEWRQLQLHPIHGRELIETTFMRDAAPIVAQHHERFDGSGYPYGLSGEDVLIEAYIVAVADTFDAMTTDRPYRDARPREEAIAELERLRQVTFPDVVIDAFLRALPQTEI